MRLIQHHLVNVHSLAGNRDKNGDISDKGEPWPTGGQIQSGQRHGMITYKRVGCNAQSSTIAEYICSYCCWGLIKVWWTSTSRSAVRFASGVSRMPAYPFAAEQLII